MLATQMEATDARRMFPCWDEPVFRASVDLAVILPPKLKAVSNMPIVNEAVLPPALKKLISSHSSDGKLSRRFGLWRTRRAERRG